MSNPTDWDDSLTTPPEGAAEASAAEREGDEGPAVGRDEWVARHEERRTRRGGWIGTVEERLVRVPWWAWLTLFVAVVCLLPIGVENGYVRRVAFDTVIFMLLALGLNVVVGWGGLLDLGYVAFFGIGAYAYAFLSSEKYDLHLPTPFTIVVVVLIGALAGLLVGLPSRRLTGDYLAIVTLFFFQAFLTLTNNGDDVFGRNLTNGPNGILDVDELGLFGANIPRTTSQGQFGIGYLYAALAVFAVVYVGLRLARRFPHRQGVAVASRGRAGGRGDGHAGQHAQADGVRIRRRRRRADGHACSPSLNGSVFPQDFEFPLLITVYTMVILGGAGSQAGVVLGAILVSVVLEVLREPGDSRGALLRCRPARPARALRAVRQARGRARRARSCSASWRASSPRHRRRRGHRVSPRAAAGSRAGRPTG